MTNEEFEKKKEFILEQQVRFAAGMGQLREAQAHTARVVAQTEEIVARLAKRTREGSKVANTKINASGNSQRQTDVKMTELAASQVKTAKALKNLIAVLNRYFSKRRPGN